MTIKKVESEKTSRASAPRGRQMRGVITRKRILGVAARTIAAEGIFNLKFAHIAKDANVPQALMGYHFPNVESLLVELLQREIVKLRDLSVERVERSAKEPKKALAAYIRAPFDLAAKDPEFRAIWTALHHLATVNPIFADIDMQIRKMGCERILNLITMVLATEGYLLGQTHIGRDDLLRLATSVRGLILGLCLGAAADSPADFKKAGDLAVASSFKLLGLS